MYGLGEGVQEVTLELTGVAVGGSLRVKVGDQTCSFPANQVIQQRYQVKLQQGMNSIPVHSRGGASARLLIGRTGVGRGGEPQVSLKH